MLPRASILVSRGKERGRVEVRALHCPSHWEAELMVCPRKFPILATEQNIASDIVKAVLFEFVETKLVAGSVGGDVGGESGIPVCSGVIS